MQTVRPPPYDWAIPIPGYLPKEMRMLGHPKTGIGASAFRIIAWSGNSQEQGNGLRTLRFIHTEEFDSATEGKKTLTYTQTPMNVKNVVLSKRSQMPEYIL